LSRGRGGTRNPHRIRGLETRTAAAGPVPPTGREAERVTESSQRSYGKRAGGTKKGEALSPDPGRGPRSVRPGLKSSGGRKRGLKEILHRRS